MRFIRSKVFLLLSLFTSIALTSCEEGATLDIPGPDIDFEFSYSDTLSNPLLKSGNADYRLVAQTDTIKGQDIESFLSGVGQDYSSIVESAQLSDALLAITGDANFSGVDSVQIRYQIAGSDEEFILAQAGIDTINGNSIRFNDIKIDKTEAFEMIKSNVIAKFYAIYDAPKTNCFKNGVNYRFTAKTTLSVKLSALTDGVLSAGE